MTIKKFIGKTKEEAIAKAKEEFGEGAVVMNVKEVKPSGFFSFFKSVTYEVTAAIEEKDKFTGTAANTGMHKGTETINLAADEKIVIPAPTYSAPASQPVAPVATPVVTPVADIPVSSRDEIERKLENLSNILEKKLSAEENRGNDIPETTIQNMESFKFMKMLYRTLLDNEVHEKYVNQILDEAEKMANSNSSVDVILSNV